MENLATTVQSLLDQEKVRWPQWALFLLCFFVIAVDGFDTQVIAFTGPSILKAFAVTRVDLSHVFIASTVGMALGASGFGLLGDRLGRRPVAIAAVFLFGIFTIAIAYVTSFNQLIILRFFTGLGIGGATPVVVALASEYAPSRIRAMVISAVVSGLPLGAVFGAMLAKQWLSIVGWQAMYFYGGIAAFVVLILCVLFLPESAQLLVARERDRDYLRARTLISKFLGKEVPYQYRLIAPVKVKNVSVIALFAPNYWRLTLGIWGGYFFNYLAWLALLFWLPTVLVASGMGAASAPLATMILNLVAAFFIFPLAFILQRINDVRLLVSGMFVFGILICLSLAFCSGPETLVLTLIGLAGIGVGLEQMGLYYLAAALYPERLRATGIGWGVALGRVGSIGGGWFGSFFLHGTGVTGFYLGLIPPLVLALGAVLVIPRQIKAEHDGSGANGLRSPNHDYKA